MMGGRCSRVHRCSRAKGVFKVKSSGDSPKVAYLGPAGTFTEEALETVTKRHRFVKVECSTIEETLELADTGDADYAFVPIENSIEGTVISTLDTLIFRANLLIQKEVVYPIHQYLLGLASVELSQIKKVFSYPHALAQVKRFLAAKLPATELVPVSSTAEGARMVAEGNLADAAAVAPRMAGERWGLVPLAENIEDHPDNETRFLLLAKGTIPRRSGQDKTSVVCFQVEDRPGSLLSILVQFASRGINLTKLESRPSKTSLGAYCFAIDFEGHVDDPTIAQTLDDLDRITGGIKFLGSYPEYRKVTTRRAPSSPSYVVQLLEKSRRCDPLA
jgi:prephenate dehydratase